MTERELAAARKPRFRAATVSTYVVKFVLFWHEYFLGPLYLIEINKVK